MICELSEETDKVQELVDPNQNTLREELLYF